MITRVGNYAGKLIPRASVTIVLSLRHLAHMAKYDEIRAWPDPTTADLFLTTACCDQPLEPAAKGCSKSRKVVIARYTRSHPLRQS